MEAEKAAQPSQAPPEPQSEFHFGFAPLLVGVLRQNMRVRMDVNKNHRRPHVHVDYGKEYHTAAYAIDTGERLAGVLDGRYDREVCDWIAECRPKLMELWQAMHAGERPDALIFQLRGGRK